MPRDTEVVSVKENCTAYQAVTIRPHILRNDPLHLGLGGERQRERWRKVCRGADCILQPAFWSDKHEVKIPSLPADPLSNLYFFSISISHCCHLKHIQLFPVPLYIFYLSAFHLHLHFPPTLHLLKPPSNHCSNLTLPCQYLSGQLSVSFKQISSVKSGISTWNGTEISSQTGSRWWYFPDDIFWLFLHCLFHPSLFQHTRGLTTSSTTFP